jgi:TPR repeat protein
MPEVPANMQQNLAALELEASPVDRHHSLPNIGSRPDPRLDPRAPSQQLTPRHLETDEPTFSPFPVVKNRPPNVPPSDEEKEMILENARLAVLHSQDPEMQLTWAQDVLFHVEVAMENAIRVAGDNPPRSVTPQVEHQLRVDAINIISFLADQHHPKAEFIKGMWLEFGKFGFRMDKKEAYRCYQRASQGGYARAEYRMGMQFESSNEIPKAVKHYELGISMGRDSAAYYRMGMMILLGQHGQQQDYARGVRYIKIAADNADENAPQGAYVYGMLLARELPQITVPDEILPTDLSGALYYIEKAAYLGFAKAQAKIAGAYELGQLGCDFDPVLSLHYNNLAARQGEPDAEMAISKWFLCGYEGVFKKNEDLAYAYAMRAAQYGLPTAEFAIGYFHEVGIHVAVNIPEAQVWYKKAAKHGNKDAAGRIQDISRSKTLSRKDHEATAVSRIKSTRATYKPPRVVSESPAIQMPTIPDMPEPRRRSQGGTKLPYPADDQQPYPSQSATPAAVSPYQTPTAPQNGTFQTSPNIRPVSTLLPPNNNPRPFSTLPPTTNTPQSGYYGGPPPPRSFSSQRPVSTMGEMGYDGAGSGSRLQAQPRPVSTSGPMGPGTPQPQRPVSSVGPLGYPADGRVTAMPIIPGAGLHPSQNQRPVSAYVATTQPIDTAVAAAPTPQPLLRKPVSMVDIGFSAPPDFAGADKKKYNLNDGPAPAAAGGIASLPSQQALRPDRTSSRLAEVAPLRAPFTDNPRPGLVHQQSQPVMHTQTQPQSQQTQGMRVSSAHQPGRATQPPRHDSLPVRPAKTTQVAPSPAPFAASSTAPSASSGASVKLPGKGPATFEEMGVPASKKEQDCVSRPSVCSYGVNANIYQVVM